MKKRIGDFIERVTLGIDTALRRLDMKSATGLALVILGMLIIIYPDQGTVARIVHYGGSSWGYGITSIIFGMYLFRNPDTRAYALLISPIVLYIAGFVELIWSVYGIPTPLVIYFLCGLYLLKESIRR